MTSTYIAPRNRNVQMLPAVRKVRKESPIVQTIKVYFKKFYAFLTEFLYETSAHGFVYLIRFGLHFIERLIWGIFICIAFYGTVSVSLRTWNRYQTSPVVISMDRNMFFWNTSFPSATVCPHTKIDAEKVENYILSNPHKFPSESNVTDFRDFIATLSNLTFETVDEVDLTRNFDVPAADYMELLWNLRFGFNPAISSGLTVKLAIQDTITELGICYSVNSKHASYNSWQYWSRNNWEVLAVNETGQVHPLDGEIFIQMINLSASYDVYFHGAMEIPEISKQRLSFSSLDYSTVELLAQEILTTPSVQDLKITQRQCRFPHERSPIYLSPVYSYNQCLVECRINYIHKECSCIPHFYRSRTKDGKQFPICNLEKWKCISNIKDELFAINQKTSKVQCECLTNCNDSIYFIQAFRSRSWFLGANLQYGITDYPKMQLKRDVLFSFTDVLVYIGGTVGLFLGCSLLSVTEFLYYFTWRIAMVFLKKNSN